jgi:hypothetical protein
MAGLLAIGARVRIRRSVAQDVSELVGEGEVLRIDGRGVLVRLDSGRELLAEPGMLTILGV